MSTTVMSRRAVGRRCRCITHSQSLLQSPLPLYRSIGNHFSTGKSVSPHLQAPSAEIGSAGLTARHTSSIKSRGQNLHLGRSFFHSPTSTRTSKFSVLPSYLPRSRSFSSTPFVMTATKIDGTAIAKKIRERIHDQIAETQKVNPRYRPSLKIIQGTKLLTYINLSSADVYIYSW